MGNDPTRLAHDSPTSRFYRSQYHIRELVRHAQPPVMHELSIAQSITETARKETSSFPAGSLKEIGLRIGALSGVLVDSLEFCFEAITKGTDLESCRMKVEFLPVVATCETCSKTFEVDHFLFACPECQSGAVEVVQGYELEIAYLEVDDAVAQSEELSDHGVRYVEEDSA